MAQIAPSSENHAQVLRLTSLSSPNEPHPSQVRLSRVCRDSSERQGVFQEMTTSKDRLSMQISYLCTVTELVDE